MVVGWVLLAGCTFTADDGGLRFESGQAEREARTLGTFDRIRVDNGVDLEVEVGPEIAVVAVAEAALLPRLETGVVDGQLQVRLDGGYDTRSPLRVEVVAPSVSGVEVVGSGDGEIALLSGAKCVLSTSGSGDVAVDRIACDALTILGSGSGDLSISEGTVGALDIVLSGSGDAELSDVVAEHARATSSGSGDIAVHAERGIDASSSGSGDIRWTGDAEARVVALGSGEVGPR